MTRRITKVLACVLALAACQAESSSTIEAPSTIASPPSDAAAAFAAGTRYVYDVRWSVAASSSDAMPLPGAASLQGAMTLHGVLEVVRVGTLADAALLELRWRALDLATLEVMGTPVEVDRATLVGPRAWIVLPSDGEVHRVMFEDDSDALFRQTTTALVGHVDLGDARLVRRVVPGAHGLAEAEYSRDPEAAGRVVRRLDRYLRFDAFASDAQPLPVAEATIERDASGGLVAMTSRESVVVGDDGLRRADDRFEMRLVETSPAEGSAPPDVDGLVEHDPAAGPDADAIERQLAERFSRGMTTDDLALAVGGVENGVMPRSHVIVRATGMLRARPELAAELAPMFAGVSSRHARAFVLDVLSSAGTSEAQAVMRTLLSSPATQASADYHMLVQRLALLTDPEPRTAELVLAGFDDAMAADDGARAVAFAYPMGAVCRRLHRDPMLAALLHDRLVEALAAATTPAMRVAMLEGLGNAGRPTDVARVLPYLGDADAGVRTSAVAALRLVDTPTSRAAVTAMLGDRERVVAQRALAILEQYLFADRPAPALAAAARLGMHHPDIADALALSLLPRRDDPGVRAGLDALVHRVTPDTRRRLAAILK